MSNVNKLTDLREISIYKDAYIHSLYKTAFQHISACLPHHCEVIVEIGSGSGVGGHFLSGMILTDISFSPSLDLTCRSENLPIRSDSVDALILKDALHHIPDVEAFLSEATRVLRVGGRAVIFEPYWGFLARFVFKFIHQEEYDDSSDRWGFESKSPWDSNQALSFILLRRDRSRLESSYPQLVADERKVLVGPSFLISGGVSRRTRISGRLLKQILEWEMKRGPWMNHFRFFHIFTLTKQQKV